MRIWLNCAICLSLGAGAGWSHHSFAGEFDEKKPVSLRGTVTKIDWINPHVFLYLDVPDEDGNVAHWTIESGSPSALSRSGWTRDFLKVGELVTVGGFQSKDGRNYASGLQVRRKAGAQVLGPPEQK
jgi:hypothetical protein